MTEPGSLSRRSLIAGTAGLVGAAALAPRGASAQASPPANAQLGTPASTITTPPRDWSPGHPSIYPDPDVIVVDPSFRQFAPGNSAPAVAWTLRSRVVVFADDKFLRHIRSIDRYGLRRKPPVRARNSARASWCWNVSRCFMVSGRHDPPTRVWLVPSSLI
jgi:hypothetical protein